MARDTTRVKSSNTNLLSAQYDTLYGIIFEFYVFIARRYLYLGGDLARKLRRCINDYSANSRPIRWKYSNPAAPTDLMQSARPEMFEPQLRC